MLNTALIIASDDNGVQPVFTVPNVRRLVLLATRLGFNNIHVIGRIDPVIPIVSDLLPAGSFHSAEKLSQLNDIVQQIQLDGQARVLVLKADVVIDRLSLAEFLKTDQSLPIARMKLSSNGDPDGIYLTYPNNLVQIVEALWSPAVADAQSFLRDVNDFCSHDGLPRFVGQGENDARRCEEKLIGVLAAHTAQTDGFMARHFDRRISQFFSKRLVQTNIKPNQVTLIGVSIGLTAAFLLSLSSYWAHLLGALLFVFCVIVDGVDGEVARLKLMESRFGHYLDITTDNLVHVAVFVGIAFGLYHGTGNRLYIWALWFLLGGFVICSLAVYQCIKRVDPEAFKQSPRLVRLMKMLSNRDFAYLILLLALIDHLEWFLLGAAAGTYLFAGGLWYLTYKHKNQRAKKTSTA